MVALGLFYFSNRTIPKPLNIDIAREIIQLVFATKLNIWIKQKLMLRVIWYEKKNYYFNQFDDKSFLNIIEQQDVERF